MFADPQSTTAARLTGCKNILSCTRVDAHTVRLTGWDAPLRLAAEVPETCTAVGIRAHDFAPCAPAAPNALPVQLNSTSENPFDWNLIFTAPDGTTRLWWKVSKTNLTAASPEAPAFWALHRRTSCRWGDGQHAGDFLQRFLIGLVQVLDREPQSDHAVCHAGNVLGAAHQLNHFRSRFCLACSVGAKLYFASTPTACRLNSSG